MTPEETIKYCLHGYHQDTREANNLNGHLYDRRFHYGRARAFLEVIEALARAAEMDERQVLKIQKQVIKERHESGADR